MENGSKTLDALVVRPREDHPIDNLQDEQLERLRERGDLHDTFRNCALAALSAGKLRKIEELHGDFPEFRIHLDKRAGQVEFTLENLPMRSTEEIRGKRRLLKSLSEHIRSIATDLTTLAELPQPTTPEEVNKQVRFLLEQAGVLNIQRVHGTPILPITYWGGQRIKDEPYTFAKIVGKFLGQSYYRITTGGGFGTMRAPISGVISGYESQHMKTRIPKLGITHPHIIGNEPPNELLDPLVITRNMEERLVAFVRSAVGIVIGEGGVGTTEELLYISAIMLDENNADEKLGVVLSGPNKAYFEMMQNFLQTVLGKKQWQKLLENIAIKVGDPQEAALEIKRQVEQEVLPYRRSEQISKAWNDRLHIDDGLIMPFASSHESIAEQVLSKDLEPHELLIRLRRVLSAFSWVTASVEGNKEVQEKGPIEIVADIAIKDSLEQLLDQFDKDKRYNFRGNDFSTHVFRKA